MKHLLTLFCCLCAPALQASSLFYLTPPAPTVTVGDIFEEDLSIGPLPQEIMQPGNYGISDLYAFQVEVDFDPTVLQVTAVNEGTLLPDYASSIGTTTSWVPLIVDNVNGAALFFDTLIGAQFGADTSNGGTLLSIDFQAIAPSPGSTVSTSNVCLQNSQDDVPNGTCELSDSVIGTANLDATSVVQVDTPEPSTWSYFMVGATVLVIGRVRRRRVP